MNATRPRRHRPVLVWIVLVWSLVSAGFTLFSFWLIYVRAMPISPDAAVYLASLSPLDHAGTALLLLLNLAGAVALVMLRKIAVALFVAALALSLLITLGNVMARGFLSTLGGAGALGLLVGFLINISICLYAWRLKTRGLLV